jgi:hypothetical protein
MEYFSVLKGTDMLIHASTQMNLEDMLNEISQTQKDKYCIILSM